MWATADLAPPLPSLGTQPRLNTPLPGIPGVSLPGIPPTEPPLVPVTNTVPPPPVPVLVLNNRAAQRYARMLDAIIRGGYTISPAELTRYRILAFGDGGA